MSGWLGLGIVLVLFSINLQLFVLIEVNKTIAKALTDIRYEISALKEEEKRNDSQ